MKSERYDERLPRYGLVIVVLAVGYGIAAGAYVAMYYDVVAGMDGREDGLAAGLIALYVLAAALGLPELPLALWDLRHGLLRQGLVRSLAFAGPLAVLLGADGLVAHRLGWAPISGSDRFHLLHHSLVAGAPLTVLYALALRRWWRPATFAAAPPVSRAFVVLSGVLIAGLGLGAGILFGTPQLGLGLALGGEALAAIAFVRERRIIRSPGR